MALFVLAGCGGVDEAGPVPTPVPTLSSRAPSPPVVVASASASARASGNPTLAVGAVADVRTMRTEPGGVRPFACTPPAPERPEVIVEVAPVGPGTAELIVKLEYAADTESDRYQGAVLMRFDVARKVFTYRLPAVSRANLSPRTANIVLTVHVKLHVDPRELASPPPFTGIIPVVESCPNRTG
jgi:hypothetical protein